MCWELILQYAYFHPLERFSVLPLIWKQIPAASEAIRLEIARRLS
jgi:hypothetical protein